MGDFEYLKGGYYVRWFNPSTNAYQYYWLKQEETEPGYIYKFQTAISATSAGSYEAVKDMQPSPGHLFEMLMGFQTRCDVFLQVPGGSAVGGTDQRPTETSTFEAVGFYNMMMSPFYHPDPITHIYFAYLGNLLYYPWVKAYNPTPITLTPRIRFVGKMFETQLVQDTDLISRLDKRVIPWTPISLGMLVGKGRTAQS